MLTLHRQQISAPSNEPVVFLQMQMSESVLVLNHFNPIWFELIMFNISVGCLADD